MIVLAQYTIQPNSLPKQKTETRTRKHNQKQKTENGNRITESRITENRKRKNALPPASSFCFPREVCASATRKALWNLGF